MGGPKNSRHLLNERKDTDHCNHCNHCKHYCTLVATCTAGKGEETLLDSLADADLVPDTGKGLVTLLG